MKILLLAGGNSTEREVSLASGQSVFESLLRQEHTVFAIDPSTNKSLVGNDNVFLEFKSEESSKLSTKKPDLRSLANTIGSPGFDDVDVVFIALHGGAGENGTIQSLLNLADKKYTGSDMIASAVSMDKVISKHLFRSIGIPTPDWTLYRLASEEIEDATISDITNNHSFPVIIKPNDGGSTLGLSRVDSQDQLKDAILKSYQESSNVLVEQFIEGRELTVAVLDDQIFPVVEIKSSNKVYDYEAKYTSGKSTYIVPADLDSELAEKIQADAKKAFDVIGAKGLARIDFLLDENGQYYCLELNSQPGMTDLSLAPMAAKASGIDFDKLIKMVIDSALG